MKPATLATPRLILRRPELSDAADIAAAWQDSETRRWTAVPAAGTATEARDFVTRWCAKGWADDTNYLFTMRTRHTGRFVGTLGIFGLSWVGLSEQLAWVGYSTAPEMRGRGYTAEALRATARWAFTKLQLDRLEAVVEDGNHASLACLRKAGFQVEGRHRARVVQDGERRDAWTAALLPQDLGVPSRFPYTPPGLPPAAPVDA